MEIPEPILAVISLVEDLLGTDLLSFFGDRVIGDTTFKEHYGV